jgi:hypothetical protein
MLSALRWLPVNVVLSSEDVNQILSVMFVTEPMVKKIRTRVSPNKPLNPQPLASAIAPICSTVKAIPIIHIQDDLEPETFPSTFVTEHPLSSPQPQFPTPKTTSPPQTTNPEPMKLDQLEKAEKELPETT